MKTTYFILLLIILFLFSCNYKNLKYINNPKNSPDTSGMVYYNLPETYKLIPGDKIQLSVISDDKIISNLFLSNDPAQSSMQGGIKRFTVSDSGFVTLPVFGAFYVQNKSISQIENLIQVKSDKMLIDALIDVQLASFTIFFIGEIGNGAKEFTQEKLTLLEALAQAGGIPSSGDRTNVKIIRKIPNGHKIMIVDVTKRNLLESSLFYLQPNDMIYVEALPSSQFRKTLTDYTLIISIATTTISTIAILLNLFKP